MSFPKFTHLSLMLTLSLILFSSGPATRALVASLPQDTLDLGVEGGSGRLALQSNALSLPTVLSLNYANSQPGGYFTVTGWNFPPSSLAIITVNGQTLTGSVAVNATGSFNFFLNTAGADAGFYTITASVKPSAAASFFLDEGAPLRAQEGGGLTLTVPPGIALDVFKAHLPYLSTSPSARVCDNVTITFSPSQATYHAGDSVEVIVRGIQPADGRVELQWIRSTANTQLSHAAWTSLEVMWDASASAYRAAWVITNALTVPPPLDKSPDQEFIIAVTLWDEAAGQFICSGNPDPGQVASHPELAEAQCANCYKVLVTRDEPVGPTTSLARFWNVEPGYSFTYHGDRLDDPEDDNGVPITVTFETRMEYEAPVQLCPDTPLIPQRWTKNNRWGYWAPSAAKPEDRLGSIWTDGKIALRFFLSDPRYAYTWEDTLRGAYAHKIYEVVNDDYRLGYLSDVLNRTIIHSSRNHENYYYPPYLLSYGAAPNFGQDTFLRVDSLYDHFITDAPGAICQTSTPAEDHLWYTRVQFLTDDLLRSEFSQIQGYFTGTKDLVVLTFFEGGNYSGKRLVLREDWYLMEDVGLVGVDQASWDQDDTGAADIYLNTPFLRENTPAEPHMRLRAERGYIGGPLAITPISPGSSFPMTITPGNCYTVAVHSTTPIPMPYDGRLENDATNPPSVWSKAIGGEAHWAANGLITECLPGDFPPGEYKVRLRPYVTPSHSAQETPLSYTPMPWSTNYLWVIVLAP